MQRLPIISGPATHDGVQCDICQVFPIVGDRYKCGNCIDYDLCQLCEPNTTHDATHIFIKLKQPLPDVYADMDNCLLRSNLYSNVQPPIQPTPIRLACSVGPPRLQPPPLACVVAPPRITPMHPPLACRAPPRFTPSEPPPQPQVACAARPPSYITPQISTTPPTSSRPAVRKACKRRASSKDDQNRPSSVGHAINAPVGCGMYLNVPNQASTLPCVGIDLVAGAVEVLRLQEKISQTEGFFEVENLNSIIEKYIQFLELKSKNPDLNLVPSDDIEYIWESHLIRPEVYYQDCNDLFGKVIPHSIGIDATKKEQGIKNFESLYDPSLKLGFKISISAKDIIADEKWFGYFKAYCSQMSVPYTDPSFLYDSYTGYKQFLQICMSNRESDALEPTYPIDLFWHTHMAHPVEYKNYTESTIGEWLVHEPWPERFTVQQMFENLDDMDKIWSQTFGSSIHDIRNKYETTSNSCQ
eukprot:TRINITY_DN2469_c0_g1_i1.p1 TRINITY_DN2469_c0_g1~~TRINITY_DN2469_c0_g1_i1.p1  ORF type:complete len:470 (-),score=71.10 TRINITY_DN2469_c0_g1_i1:73-1482(-)